MAHTHSQVIINSANNEHSHPTTRTGTRRCTTGYPVHQHTINHALADLHNHQLTLDFGSAALGSPWWNHTHPITLTACSSAGAGHAHTINSIAANVCGYCVVAHAHSPGTGAFGNGGASHTHTLAAVNTQTADPSGTPENHVHPFSITLDLGNGHTHTLSGLTTNDACDEGYSHGHSCAVISSSNSHDHGASGNSGSGGEAPPAAAPLYIMDGLVFLGWLA